MNLIKLAMAFAGILSGMEGLYANNLSEISDTIQINIQKETAQAIEP